MGVIGPKKETEKGIKDLKDKIKILPENTNVPPTSKK